MRLIDKDNLRKPSKGMFIYQDEFEDDVQHVAFEAYTKDDIEREPTVEAIPLDKPFCKMVYGDYVCYNRNWLMKHLPMELDILQGKTIPIEWIKRKAFENPSLSRNLFYRLIIEEWEKENESNVSN